MQVNEIMTSNPRTIALTTTIGQAWEELRELDVRHLPISTGPSGSGWQWLEDGGGGPMFGLRGGRHA
jgi:hypothetical protein